jgi:hypothetical protein
VSGIGIESLVLWGNAPLSNRGKLCTKTPVEHQHAGGKPPAADQQATLRVVLAFERARDDREIESSVQYRQRGDRV